MPIDYSKWDKIELSDDEDFECHPNVDKKSMVKWKQAQIHKERKQRVDQQDLLTLERDIAAKFISEFPTQFKGILATNDTELMWKDLEALKESLDAKYTERIRSESMARINAWPRNWDPPVWGDVLRDHRPWHDEIAKIVETVKYGSEKAPSLDSIKAVLMAQVDDYIKALVVRQDRIKAQVQTLQEEMDKKLTVDNLKEGFNKTMIKKHDAAPAADRQTIKTVETIHEPKSKHLSELEGIPIEEIQEFVMSGLQASDKDLTDIHPNLLPFSSLSDFGDIYRALKATPALMTEKCEEALMLRALTLEILTKSNAAKNCVVLSEMIKFTRELGVSGVDVFFEKLAKSESSAHTMFYSEVKKVTEHIIARGAVLRKERVNEYKKAQADAQAYQEKRVAAVKAYTQADGTFKMPVPENPSDIQLKYATWFDALPHTFQQGLLYEDVEKINEYLGSLDPEEAETQADMAIQAGFIHTDDGDEEEEEAE